MDIEGLSKATQQSVITRLLANCFLFAVLMTALAVGALELVNTSTVNPIIMTIIGTGIGMATHAAGINQGVILQPLDTGKQPAVTTTRTTSSTDATSTTNN